MALSTFTLYWHALKNRIRPMMQHIVLGSYLIGLIPTLVLGGTYVMLTKGSTTTEAQSTTTSQVERRTIVSGVKATGKVTFASEQTLKFNQKGTVAKVNVKEGDHVKAGQVIAELDKSSVLADIRSAQLAVGASALQLKQLQSDKQKTILDAQNALDDAERQYEQAQSDLNISKEKLPAALETAKTTVQEKQTALDQAKLDLEKQKSAELQSLAGTSQSTLTTAEGLLDSFYSILTNSSSARPSVGNFDLEIYHLLYNDTTLALQTKNAYLNAVNSANAMHTKYGSSLATVRDPAILVQALVDAHNLAASVYSLGELSYSLLQGATTDTSKFPVSDLESLRASISSNRTKTSGLLDTIETAQANLSAVASSGGIPSITLQAKENAVVTAQNDLKQSQDSLNLLQTQNPADLKKLADTIEQMKASLASKKAALNSTTTSTDVNIQLKQNDVAQKATSAQKATKVLQDYQLTAPFDGVITHLDYKKGDNLLDTGDTESATIQNPDFIVVTIPLDQVDIIRVHKDQTASIIFDALPGQTFTGVIDTIDSTPIESSGVVSYNVSIKLPAPKDLTILSGMTATVNVETTRKENVLVVPNLALHKQGTRVTVQTAAGQSVAVTTGATDGQYTEILTGLQEGDSVVSINVTASAATTNANSAQQIFRLGGGGGGGFGGAAAGGTTVRRAGN